jgi:GNAT superfamily N-acetyltransferase
VSEIVVRPMRPSDLEGVRALFEQLGYSSTVVQLAQRYDQLTQDPDFQLLVAEDEHGEVVGTVSVHGHHTLESPSLAEVDGLVVDKRRRRSGIGRALMRAAEAWAVRQGYNELFLRTNITRADTHRFYRGIGYDSPKTHLIFVRPLT